MGIGSFFFGSKKPSSDWVEDQTSYGAAFGLGNRAGAQYVGRDPNNPNRPLFDYSKSFQNIDPNQAASKYKGFGDMEKASRMYSKPSLFSQTYNPAQFNFESLPDQYYQGSYDLGAKNIRREGQGNLKQLRESLGPRNQGLLFKAGANANRQQEENLAGLASKLGLERMQEKSQLGKEQQIAQAGEGYKGYQSRADLEDRIAKDQLTRAAGLESIGRSKLAGQLDATNAERDYQDKALQYLLDMYQKKFQTRAATPSGGGLLNNLAGSAGGIASAFTGK